MENSCGPNIILIDSVCRHLTDDSLCPRLGEGVFGNAKGEPSCDCWDGWTRSGMNKEINESANASDEHDRCYQLFTTGFCEENQIVTVSDNIPVCIDNPCGNSSEYLPHQ